MTNLIAYHNNPTIKADILAQLKAHRAADQLVQGTSWENGKGCAVGCTLHGYDHMEYETRFGIPVAIARLKDSTFEGLTNAMAMDWPIRIMTAIEPGQDLTRVHWHLLHWLLTDETINPGISHPTVKDAVRQCADLMATLKDGGSVTESAAEAAEAAAEAAAWSARAAEAAEAAAWSVRSVRSAAWSVRSVRSAARSAAWSAAWSARAAAWSARAAEAAEAAACSARAAEAAEAAACSARAAAEAAAWSAEAAEAAEAAAWSAWSAAGAAAWSKISDKMIELIEAALMHEDVAGAAQ